jgi:hypothetical protein
VISSERRPIIASTPKSKQETVSLFLGGCIKAHSDNLAVNLENSGKKKRVKKRNFVFS